MFNNLTDPERFRFARDTSFGRRHLSFWTKNSVLLWIVSILDLKFIIKINFELKKSIIIENNILCYIFIFNYFICNLICRFVSSGNL